MLNTTLIEAYAFKAARRYFEDRGFTEIFPPRIVRASGACENINTLFEVRVDGQVDWFEPHGHKAHAYLAQTGQLYLEAFVPLLNKVFCVGPSFRAEAGVDDRHLTEFNMLEIEFAGDFEDLLEYIQGTVTHVAHMVADCHRELSLDDRQARRLKRCPNIFPRLTYDQAIEELAAMDEKIRWGDDIDGRREQMLVKSHGDHPLFITHYPDPMYQVDHPIEVEKFFNMLPDPKNPGRVQSADLILPLAGESVGAAARVHDLNTLVERLKSSRMFARLMERGGSLSDFEWYISQVKTNGAVPHAGCGFGMARILKWLQGTPDIRQAVTFPQNKETLI